MIYLPLAGEENEILVEEVAVAEPEPRAQVEEIPDGESSAATILLVEDDPMIRGLVSQTLEAKGYKVLAADDGWVAVQLARKYDGAIDLLFTDVVMPGLGGAELAVAVRELYPEINMLFMSGYSRAQVTEEGVPLDAALLEKPFTPDKVISMVAGLLTS
jgi:CheY-like chemotaxis protein